MSTCRRTAMLVLFLMGSTPLAFGAPHGRPQKQASVYSARGQAAHVHGDQANSRKQAIHELLSHGVSRAFASVVGSSPESGQTREAKETILGRPERYVQTYRIHSEGPTGGIYRVAGEVTVNIEALKRDLADLTLLATPADIRPSKPPRMEPGEASPSPADTLTSSQAIPPASRGIILSKPALFWAVAEKWETEWALPSRGASQQSLFARNLLQESEDYDWTLRYPEPGLLHPDSAGDLPVEEVVMLAGEAGARHAVIGRVGLDQRPEMQPSLNVAVNLRLIEVATGSLLADVQAESGVESDALQESVMRVADSVASQLDRSLQPGRGEAEVPPPDDRRSSPAPSTDGTWVITLRGDNHYAYWEGLQGALRERFKDMRIHSVDVAGGETRIALEGIDEAFFSSIETESLPGGLGAKVVRISPESFQVELSVERRVGAEPPTESHP